MAVDSSGNVVVTGFFHGTMDFVGGKLTSNGGPDIFVARLAGNNGGHLWSKGFGSKTADPNLLAEQGLAVAVVDVKDNVVATGLFQGTVDFGGGPLTNAGSEDIFVVELSGSTGAHLRSKRFGSTASDQGLGVKVDTGGNLVVTGSFAGTVDFGSGPVSSPGSGIFLLKLAP